MDTRANNSFHRLLDIAIKFVTPTFFLILIYLLYTVIRSGFYYQYDNDELSQIQIIYLKSNGFLPYKSFLLTYTTIFYDFLQPLFAIFGFNFTTIGYARVIMILLFIFRTAVAYFLVRNIFGNFVGFFFLPLLLLDPFTVFSGMQVRPDNLMMTLYTLSLLFFYLGISRSQSIILFFSGLILSLSVITLAKILPSLVVTITVFSIYCLTTRRYKLFFIFLIGCLTGIFIFLSTFDSVKSFQQMVQNVIFDRMLLNMALLGQNKVEFFYRPNNLYLFGLQGKPLTWIYVWVLPVLAFTGILITLYQVTKKINKFLSDITTMLKIMFMGFLVSQWLTLFTVPGIFLQYFLPISWLLALFGAVTLTGVMEYTQKYLNASKLLLLLYFFAFLGFASHSIMANIRRASIGNQSITKTYERLWSIIPINEASFPNILFRPLTYPISMGMFIGDVPRSILTRFGPISYALEKQKVKYLFLDDYSRIFFDQQTRDYIEQNYSRWDASLSLYKRRD